MFYVLTSNYFNTILFFINNRFYVVFVTYFFYKFFIMALLFTSNYFFTKIIYFNTYFFTKILCLRYIFLHIISSSKIIFYHCINILSIEIFIYHYFVLRIFILWQHKYVLITYFINTNIVTQNNIFATKYSCLSTHLYLIYE